MHKKTFQCKAQEKQVFAAEHGLKGLCSFPFENNKMKAPRDPERPEFTKWFYDHEVEQYKQVSVGCVYSKVCSLCSLAGQVLSRMGICCC
jgi:hypothetical protein